LFNEIIQSPKLDVSKLEVNGVEYDTFLNAEAQPYINSVEMSTMDLAESLTAARAAKCELVAFGETSKHWKAPMDWSAQAATIQQYFKALRSGLRRCYNVRDSLHNLKASSKQETQNSKKTWHLEKAKVETYLDRNTVGTPPCLRKAFAEMIYTSIYPPENVGVPRVFSIPKLLFGASDGRDAFKEPTLVQRPKITDTGVEYADGFAKGCATHKVKIDNLVLERRKTQISKLSLKFPCILGSLLDDTDKFEHNGEFEPNLTIFNPLATPTIVVTKRVMVQDLHLISNSLRAHPHVFRVFTGRVVMLLLPPAAFLDKPDLVAWMKSLEVKELHEFYGQVLESGDAVTIPLGWTPLWMGLPVALNIDTPKIQLAPRGKHSQGQKAPVPYDEHTTVCLQMCYEEDQLDNVSVDLKTRLYQNYVGTKSFMATISSTTGFDAWMTKCAPPPKQPAATV